MGAKDGPKGSVLVVDDDADIRAMLAQVLELEGYGVDTAADGAEALARLRRGPPPDVVLLDLMMPGMNGWQFREQQLADPAIAGVPIMILTGDGSVDSTSTSLGDVGFLRKPIDLDTLLAVVGDYCS